MLGQAPDRPAPRPGVDEGGVAAERGILITDTKKVAGGAGAAGLAAAIRLRSRWPGATVGFALTGGNVDKDVFARVLV